MPDKKDKQYISVSTTMDMPNDIIIDGVKLNHCMFKHGNKTHQKSNYDVQESIIELWNTYKSPSTTPKKKEEVKQALLFWERYLAEETSGNLSFTPKEQAQDQEYRSKLWKRRYARENDLLNAADYKRKAIYNDEEHNHLHQTNSQDIYDVKDSIRGLKFIKKEEDQ